MVFEKQKFESQLPSFFPSLLEKLFSFGFIPTVVGGIVRDFLLTEKVGHDWDMELGHDTIAFNQDQWRDFGKSLSVFGKMTFLPYDVIRLGVESYQFEFSPPRIETFHPKKNHHSNFTVEFDFKLPFEKAVLRRDFTINTMGVRFKNKTQLEFLDPLKGQTHLRDFMLYPAGPDFPKDPVRFLRAHRFALKNNFEFSPELIKILNEMTVDGFTASYLWSEMQKSQDAISFLERLLREKRLHPEMKLPLAEDDLPKLKHMRKVLSDSSRHESWIIALEWVDLSAENWCKTFSVGSDTSRKLARWAKTSKLYQNIRPETYHGEFEALRDTKEFEMIFDWYFSTKQLLQKNPELPLLEMIEEYLPDWIHLYRFEAPKDVKHIDPPYRAKFQVWALCQRL